MTIVLTPINAWLLKRAFSTRAPEKPYRCASGQSVQPCTVSDDSPTGAPSTGSPIT